MKEILTEQLIRHEGEKLTVYLCPAGYKTIGVGRNLETRGLTKEELLHLELPNLSRPEIITILEDTGITKEESRYLLSNDIDSCIIELTKRLSFFSRLPESAKIVLVNLDFNLGLNGLLKFKKTLSLIEIGQYIAASEEMLNSSWKNQVGQRAYDLSKLLAQTV